MDARHAFGFQQVGDEIFVRADGLAVRRRLADAPRARGVDIKSAFGRQAFDAWSLAQTALISGGMGLAWPFVEPALKRAA